MKPSDLVLTIGELLGPEDNQFACLEFKDHYNRERVRRKAAERKGLMYVRDDRRALVTMRAQGKAREVPRSTQTTIYPGKVVRSGPGDMPLKPGKYSTKLGGKVAVGDLLGAPIYSLTLIERETCPKTCKLWTTCYGNSMHLAKRYVWDKSLQDAIYWQLTALKAYEKPILLRLHVLGDFPSASAVRWWGEVLDKLPLLHIFGFTSWPWHSRPGKAIDDLRAEQPKRFIIRRSGKQEPWGATVTNQVTADSHIQRETGRAIICPAERTAAGFGPKTAACCAQCGLCYNPKIENEIVFFEHGA